jgi:glycosyltransferase involved in cell wall biosynthesis
MVGGAHRWLYSHASAVVVLGRDMQALVEGRAVERRGAVVIIPNWADIDAITPAPRPTNPLLQELGLQEKFVVQYSGNMGRTHDLESIVECARRCVDEPDIHFLFLGWGAKEPWLRRTVSGSNLANITVLPPRPRSEIPVSLNACDLAVISFMPKMAGVSVPSRMYNVMAAGKPMIAVADPESEIARLVREEAVGWVVEPQRPDLLLAAVREARADQAALAAMGARARRAAEAKYSPESAMVKYNRLFDELSGPRQGAG